MTKGESHRAARRGRRPRGETLWNAAAITGLLLVGLLLGGIAGVFLDRQGLFGSEPLMTAAAPPAPAAPPATRPAPRVVAAAPEINRETLTHLMEGCRGDARPECPILQGLAGKTAAAAAN